MYDLHYILIGLCWSRQKFVISNFLFLSTKGTQVHLENWEDTTKHQGEKSNLTVQSKHLVDLKDYMPWFVPFSPPPEPNILLAPANMLFLRPEF